MKILAFSDLHEDINAFNKLKKKTTHVDIIVCAGDFTLFENKLIEMIKKIASLNKPTYLIHGNHETASHVYKETTKYPHIRYIHNKVYHINDEISIFGYGGGGFSSKDKNFENYILKNKSKLNKKNILVTHAPPYNTVLDLIYDDYHAGNKTIKKYLKLFDIAISGHFHETFNKKEIIKKKTLIINPGPCGKIITL